MKITASNTQQINQNLLASKDFPPGQVDWFRGLVFPGASR